MSRLTLGLDIGGTNIKGVLLGRPRRVLHRVRWKTDALSGTAAEILSGLESRILAFLSRHDLRPGDLSGLGLACAGLVNSETGRLEGSPNLAPWEGLDLGPWLSARFDCPVTLENDVNALAFGEWRWGAGQGTRNMICLALGTGVGGGLILDGKLYRGHRGLGAELGHICIEREGRRCGCGNRGCLETYAGAAHIARAAGRALARRRPGHGELAARLAGAEPTPALLGRAARDGSRLALELLDEVGRALGVAIASYINIFAPERVILAGGVSRAGRLIIEPARREARSRLMDSSVQTLLIRLRALGDDGAAIGAALLAEERQP